MVTSESTYSDWLSTSIRGLEMVVATNVNSPELVAATSNRHIKDGLDDQHQQVREYCGHYSLELVTRRFAVMVVRMYCRWRSPNVSYTAGVSILFTHKHTRQIFLLTLKWQLGVPSYTDKWQWCRCIWGDSLTVYTCNWHVVCQFIYMSMTCSVSIHLHVSDVWCINSFTCQWRVVYQFIYMSVTCGVSIHLHVSDV